MTDVQIGSTYGINTFNVKPSIKIDKQSVKRVKHIKALRVYIDEHLNWREHIYFIASKYQHKIQNEQVNLHCGLINVYDSTPRCKLQFIIKDANFLL